MIEVDLANTYVNTGETLPVRVSHPQIFEYRQLQVEVFDAGVSNPSPRLGFGTTPSQVGEHVARVEIDSRHLPPGIYEIRLIRLHDPINPSFPSQLDFVRGSDFSRQLFEVGDSAGSPRPAAALLASVQQREAQLDQDFLSPVDIGSSERPGASRFCIFVFIRDVVIGTVIRFKHFELVPTQNGLDSRDALDFVNRFLRERTTTGLQFAYDQGVAGQSRQSNPVGVVHFPAILASSNEEARDHCVEQTNRLLLALALSRDAGGTIFEVVVLDQQGSAVKFSVTSPYVGNLLTGHLAGESAQSLEAYLGGLARDPMNAFLTGLYKEARQDRSRDFQYVRFWQILETMAESNNYDPDSPLLDYEGNVMLEGTQPRPSKGSVNLVFRLLRDSGIGATIQTWNKVNIWFAFRSAVAHYGSVARYSALSREGVRAWAQLGDEEISETPGHDRFLLELKEDTKLLLMRRLVAK